MNFAGLTKLTLQDYPDHTACILFVGGCNMRCPYCHNSQLVTTAGDITQQEALDFLAKRNNVLEGVVISGGEPTLHRDLVQFVTTVKSMGYLVKLDTNGSNYPIISSLVEQHLVDYVAMDIKNSLDNYPATVGVNFDTTDVVNTISYLLDNHVDYEFRTTVVDDFHNSASFDSIGKLVRGATRYYLQMYVDNGSTFCNTLRPPTVPQLQQYRDILSKYVEKAYIRGI